MPILMTMDLPVTRADVEALSEQLGVRGDPPSGLIVHTATETAGGVHIIDIWDSQADFERFQKDRLNPAMEKFLRERGITMDGPPPEPTYEEAFDVVRGR